MTGHAEGRWRGSRGDRPHEADGTKGTNMTQREWERRRQVADRLAELGLSQDQAETLRRCESTLRRWAEGECGGGNEWASWSIERDETSGLPYRVTYPHQGKVRRERIPDREAGALRRVKQIAAAVSGLHWHHQTDPRGCALYVSREPLTDVNYSSRGIAVA